MKSLLLGINAKYIHPNLAIRLLQANTTYPVDIKEFNIKDAKEAILSFILGNGYDFVGFSCYIWNIELIIALLKELRKHPITILLGGPEVSYHTDYYFKENLTDYIIKNEGEEAFHLLLSYLDGKTEKKEIPNLFDKDGYTFDKLVDLEHSKMAYDLLEDVEHQIVYIETSRGCPYHCAYCMASLDNKLRFFSIEEIKRQLMLLNQRKARTFKFLDRTFNANKKNFISLIDYIIQEHLEFQSYQFEITGDLLDESIIDHIHQHAPKHLFRFEIGIQSTNIKANKAVGRIQNNERLFHNIRMIQDADIIDLHLDLIAGLPYEDLTSFERTFNEVVSLKPKELQLGFLKLLYGTKLHEDAKKYDYCWHPKAPYEIISHKDMSQEDIAKIHSCEKAFDLFYNADPFINSKKLLIDLLDNPFQFFYQLGLDLESIRFSSLEQRFSFLDEHLKGYPFYPKLHKALLLDYLAYYKLKPKAWWSEQLSPSEKKQLLRSLKEQQKIQEDIVILYKYSLVICLENEVIVAIYQENDKKVYCISSS